MDRLQPLLVTAALLLLPLVPAAILYFMLTPKRGDNADSGSAGGELESGTIDLWRFKFRFNVVGSTATYVVLLVAATWIYHELREAELQANSLRDRQAWVVEVPLNLKGPTGAAIMADQGQMQQVRVELEPSPTVAWPNRIQFWVVPNNSRFPTARFSVAGLTLKPTILDLNDAQRVDPDQSKKKLTGIEPVWLELGSPYDSTAAR